MAITCNYVLEDINFKPSQAVDRAAAYDLKAYISTSLKATDFKAIEHAMFDLGADIYVDGKRYDRKYSDLKPSFQHSNAVVLLPGNSKSFSTGFKVSLSSDNPQATATMLICSRSGLACKHDVVVVNAPGIVDEGYPLTVEVYLANHSSNIHIFTHGARIAQAMFIETLLPQEIISDALEISSARIGGFGSTGV
jgi:dUTP pyrophosphatase